MNITKQTIRRIAVVLSAVLLLTATALAVVFGLKGSPQTGTVDLDIDHNDNVIVTPETNPAMMMSVLRAGEKTENVNPPSGDTDGISITATIGPETVENKEIQWTVKWKESTPGSNHSGGTGKSAGWGEGKPLADYITLSSTSTQSGESITVSCKQDFGEQIIVTATSASNSEISASCTVDYCQKIKSLNYIFKYGGNATSAPAADSDGVYRVDYTGEEKNYSVECVPVYTNYTVEDEFVKSINGAFSDEFGYVASHALTEISLQAGLYGGNYEPKLSSAGEQYVQTVRNAATASGNPLFSMMDYADELYATLSETDKAHSKTINAHEAYVLMQDAILASENGTLSEEKRAETLSLLNGYTPPVVTGNFTGEAAIATENELLTAAKACNDAGTGILEYTITYTGVYSAKTFTFKLGYTVSSVSAARTMSLSLPSVMF